MDTKDLVYVLAQSIAREQLERIRTILVQHLIELTSLDEIGIKDGRVKGYLSLSNYTCPICRVMDLQPLQRKRLFSKPRKLLDIDGYSCQTEHCRAKGIVVPPKLVEDMLDRMVHEVRSCPDCGADTHWMDRFCSDCGAKLTLDR